MDIQKFEELLKKVNQVIFTIEKLRKADAQNKDTIEKLSEENLKLKGKVKQLSNELRKNEELQDELEARVVEILKHLPDEDEGYQDIYDKESSNTTDIKPDESSDINEEKSSSDVDNLHSNKEQNNQEVKEEEILKDFLKNSESDQGKNLFSEAEGNCEQLETNAVKSDTKNILLGEHEQSEINFDFTTDNQFSEKELPKGVL